MWLVLFDWAQRRGKSNSGRPSNAVFLGIAFGVAGIATLKLGDGVTTPGATPERLDLIGVGINIVATLGWACGSIWGRTAARAASPVTACAMQMLVGGVILLTVSPFFESWVSVDIAALPASFWWSWSYLIVFGSLCGFTAYIWLLQHVSAAKVGTYAYVNPIIALAIGVVLNGERFTPTQAAACGLILVGVVVITIFRSRIDRPANAEPPAADVKRASADS
jgi:drug/metabolite transporter (DMT)-like permease